MAETRLVPCVSCLLTAGFPQWDFLHLNPGRLGTNRHGSGSSAFTTGFNLSKLAQQLILYANFWYTLHTDFTTDTAAMGGTGVGASVTGANHPPDTVTINLAREWPCASSYFLAWRFTISSLIRNPTSMATTTTRNNWPRIASTIAKDLVIPHAGAASIYPRVVSDRKLIFQ
jgi:hypothetical protein